jgi:Ca2+/Na+ antiporter
MKIQGYIGYGAGFIATIWNIWTNQEIFQRILVTLFMVLVAIIFFIQIKDLERFRKTKQK